MTARKNFSGWRVLSALAFVFFVNVGFYFFGGAVLNTGAVNGLQLDRQVLGVAAFGLFTVIALSGPIAAWAIGRIGIRRTIVLGSLLMAVGMALNGSLVTKGWQFVTSSALFIGLGVGLSTQIPTQTCVTEWFFRRRTFALSLVWMAAGFGGFIAAPLLNVLNTVGTWRTSWLFSAALMLLSGLVAAVFVQNRPADVGQFVDGVDPSLALDLDSSKKQRSNMVFRSEINLPIRAAVRTKTFWMILLGSFAYITATNTFLAHGILLFRGLGHSSTSAAFAISMYAVGAIIGKLLSGVLGDIYEPRLIWGFGVLLMGGAFFSMISAHSDMAVYLGSAALGIGNGISNVCWPSMIANYFGPRYFAAIMAAQLPIGVIVGALGPLVAGSVYDAQHSYTVVFYGIAALCLVTSFVLFVTRPPKQPIPVSALASPTTIAGTAL
jgi:MFS family permease